MRNTFINNLVKKANDKTFLIIGDLGFGIIEPFKDKYPHQFINAGVAEQNMTGMAAGLALEGFKVFTYSIGNFNTARCLEQIRNDICYHDLDVTIVSSGAGFAYGSQGYSHHAVQDIAMLGSLPNMKLLLPGDAIEAKFVTDYIFKEKGPKYLRLGRNADKVFHNKKDKIKKINCLNPKVKSKIALVSISTMLGELFEVNELLKQNKIKSNMFSCPIIDKAFNRDIKKTLKNFNYIFTLEEHVSDLGFGSLLKNAFECSDKKIKCFGLKKDLCKVIGDRNYLCECHEISSDKIFKNIIKILNNK
jgi:transketolase